MEIPEGTFLVGYADDIAVVIEARDVDLARLLFNRVMLQVFSWLEDRGLELATNKTEIVLLTKRHINTMCPFQVGDRRSRQSRGLGRCAAERRAQEASRRCATESSTPDCVLLPHGLRARDISGRWDNTHRPSSTGETLRPSAEACSWSSGGPPDGQSQHYPGLAASVGILH